MSDVSRNETVYEFAENSLFIPSTPSSPEESPYRRYLSNLLPQESPTTTPPKRLNYVDECCVYTFNLKKKNDIKKSAFFNVVLIAILLISDMLRIYEKTIFTDSVRYVLLAICICNVISFIISYLKLYITSEVQKAKIKNHYMETIETKIEESSPDLVFYAKKSVASSADKSKTEKTCANETSVEDSISANRIFSKASDLMKYLRDLKRSKMNEYVAMSHDSSATSSPYDFWSPENRRDTSPNSVDVSPLLRNSQYQISYRETTVQSNLFWTEDPDLKSPNSDFLVKWTCNLRSWFSKTVLKRLVEEIDVVNKGLQKHGMSSCLIGSVGIETILNTANNHVISHRLPNITYLVPFLEISSNQQYIVRRIRDLAKGSSMNAFNWRSGGNYDDKLWESHLFTDAELIMNLFLTYLDTRLPLLAERPTAKPFSSEYFARMPNVPKKRNLAIVQDSSSPPHYQLMIDNNIRHIPSGRNNVFNTIVQFLRLVKKKEHGNLGNVNWGKGGLNMLWIIENTSL